MICALYHRLSKYCSRPATSVWPQSYYKYKNVMPTSGQVSSETLGVGPVIWSYQVSSLRNNGYAIIYLITTLLKQNDVNICSIINHDQHQNTFSTPFRSSRSFSHFFPIFQLHPVTSIYHVIYIQWEQRGVPFLIGLSFSILLSLYLLSFLSTIGKDCHVYF